MNKPTLPQGTRDFGPDVVRKRQFILTTIRQVFELYGFQPLETPAMENLETLMGKYGDEGDKLIFKILNNGLSDPGKVQKAKEEFEVILAGKNSTAITERALKYDLTIPFARYVAMNHSRLTFPFKRYQIQPVWRADKPQKGRYREFYQCDADVVGSTSLMNEIELACIYEEVFSQLKIDGTTIMVNSRKILTALAEISGGPEKMTDITVAIDKLDKIGLAKVKDELSTRGLSSKEIDTIEQYLAIGGTNEEKLQQVASLVGHTHSGKAGIDELAVMTAGSQANRARVTIDFTLARGLNYYTGIIFEVKGPATVKMGSIGGGGRYDDLTGLFGVPNIPGVGISFGVDRIYDVMEELDLFPKEVQTGTQVLFFNLGKEEGRHAFDLVQQLRGANIRCELYHESAKFDKQFKYAEKKGIPLIVIIGSKEMESKSCVVKELASGGQTTVPVDQLIPFLKDRRSLLFRTDNPGRD